MTDIKSMGLYRNVERILADLTAAGVPVDGPLTVDDLTAFDQYHYEGTDAVDDAINAIDIGPESTILDVGSGLGGPARYMADRTSASVTALELQPDLNATATSLTERCGLERQVTHINGNFLADVVPAAEFTGLVSMLCFLHIPDRDALFSSCARAVKAGGRMFIEDYFLKGPLTDQDQQSLAETVYCSYLPDLETYVEDVRSAGFEIMSVDDKTGLWTEFVAERFDGFRRGQAELTDRYGAETVAGLGQFYGTVADLFDGGGLGGVRLTAVRV